MAPDATLYRPHLEGEKRRASLHLRAPPPPHSPPSLASTPTASARPEMSSSSLFPLGSSTDIKSEAGASGGELRGEHATRHRSDDCEREETLTLSERATGRATSEKKSDVMRAGGSERKGRRKGDGQFHLGMEGLEK